jgi:hypothetical protein
MARTFVRTSSQVIYRTSAVLTAAPITMACWFKLTDITNFQALMSLARNNATFGDFFILAARGDVASDPLEANCFSSSPNGFGVAATTSGYAANTWHHGCAVFASATDRRVYLNGGSKGTNATSTNPISIDRTSIGALYRNTPAGYCDGLLAEAGIWNVALSDEEAAILAKGYSPLLVRPASLVAYWPLIGRYSPEIDIKGGYALTVSGATVGDHPRIIYPG